MEETKNRERRDKDNVCRVGIQMKESCRRCLFDTLCLYIDNKNENARRQKHNENKGGA